MGGVETQGSIQLVGKPLPQCKPSASRHDATSEEKKKIIPVAGGFWAVILTHPAWARHLALVWSHSKQVVADKVVPK